jgi:hypothetical protein
LISFNLCSTEEVPGLTHPRAHGGGVPHSNQVEIFNSICVSKLTNVHQRPFKVTNVCTVKRPWACLLRHFKIRNACF